MAHLFESGLFVSEPAWHGLGVLLPDAPDVDTAIKCAGLDWEVGHMPIYTGSGTPVENHRLVMRLSDGSQFGVVGLDHTIVQNRHAFDWIRPMVESGDVAIEAAGSLMEGRRVWILGKVRNAMADVVPNDPVQSYVLFAHGHDGSLAVRAGFTTTRVVCQNTLSMALGAGKNLLKFKHTAGVHDRLAVAREAFDMQRAQLKANVDVYRMLATKRLGDRNLERYIRETLSEGAANDLTIKVRNVDAIVRLAHEGRGAKPGTLWGGFNAVTEWATHERGRTADSRQNSNWFGNGSELIQRALDTAVKYAEKLPLAA